MYLFAGQPTGFKPMAEIYAVDMGMHKHIVKRFTHQGSTANDEWEPNKMFKKRDFQEIDPPRTMAEFYARYDSSVGMGTAMALFLMMVLCLASTIIKFFFKRMKRLAKSAFVQHKILRRPIIESNSTTKNSSFRSRIGKCDRRSSQTTSVGQATTLLANNDPAPPEVDMQQVQNHLTKHPNLPLPSVYPQQSPTTIQVHVIAPTPSASHHCLYSSSEERQRVEEQIAEDNEDTNNNASALRMVLQTGIHKGRLLSAGSTSSAGSEESFVSCVSSADTNNGPIAFVQQELAHLLSPDDEDSTLTCTSSPTLQSPDDERPLVHPSNNCPKTSKPQDIKRPPINVKFRLPTHKDSNDAL